MNFQINALTLKRKENKIICFVQYDDGELADIDMPLPLDSLKHLDVPIIVMYGVYFQRLAQAFTEHCYADIKAPDWPIIMLDGIGVYSEPLLDRMEEIKSTMAAKRVGFEAGTIIQCSKAHFTLLKERGDFDYE